MRLAVLFALLAFAAATGSAWMLAGHAATLVESDVRSRLRGALTAGGQDWPEIVIDGLLVTLSGAAPDEAARFRAVEIAGSVVPTANLTDRTRLAREAERPIPILALEILRSGDRISLTGTVPAQPGRDAVHRALAAAAPGIERVDLIAEVDASPPRDWAARLQLAAAAIAAVEQGAVGVGAETVVLTAAVASTEASDALARDLFARAGGVPLTLDLTAPPPVVPAFVFDLSLDGAGARLGSCVAGTEAGAAAIRRALAEIGAEGRCPVALGAPSPDWSRAVVAAIGALDGLGAGRVELFDTDVTLAAMTGGDPRALDQAAAALRGALPPMFMLRTHLPNPPLSQGPALAPAEVTVRRGSDGTVAIGGNATNGRAAEATRAYAEALFGAGRVSGALETDPPAPAGWSRHALTALDLAARLTEGSVTATPGFYEIGGTVTGPDAEAAIVALLSERLAEGEAYALALDVATRPSRAPAVTVEAARAAPPDPQICVDTVNLVLDGNQIAFAPSSADIEPASEPVIGQIAEILRGCGPLALEIGGHTDSQGSEGFNQRLSQDRAMAVVGALRAADVGTTILTARGYGESQPIADNDTEEGRTRNRRIAFALADAMYEDDPGDAATEEE